MLLLIILDFHYYPKHKKNRIYMYTKHSNYAFHCCLRTYLSPLFSDDEYGMDFLRLWRAPPLSEFSQTMGAEEKRVCSNSKTDVIVTKMNRPLTFYTLLP